jgi:hypothetical protein
MSATTSTNSAAFGSENGAQTISDNSKIAECNAQERGGERGGDGRDGDNAQPRLSIDPDAEDTDDQDEDGGQERRISTQMSYASARSVTSPEVSVVV